jgi:hypothetical protein
MLNYSPSEVVTKTSHHVTCPTCKNPDGSIDHLLGEEARCQWYCAHCGAQYIFQLSKDGTVKTARTGDRSDKTLVLLRHGNIGLVVEGNQITREGAVEGGDEFIYEEHMCPSGYLKHVLEVFDLDAKIEDPHGIFDYVATLPWDSSFDHKVISGGISEKFRQDALAHFGAVEKKS